jgi:hypothetical protein
VRFRRPRCAGGPLTHSDAADTAYDAHPPHQFTEYEWGSAMGFDADCPGWSEDDAAASRVVAALGKHMREPGVWLECGWRVTVVLLSLMEPTLHDDLTTGGLGTRVDRLYGVEVRIVSGDSSAWELATLAGPLASGTVAR